MKALLVQPPFTQLNAPYPAIHYLAAFLRSRGVEVRAVDHSIALYREVFSREGLKSAFEAARKQLAATADAASDEATVSQLERYISYEKLYLEWVDPIVAFLSGGDPAFAHRLSRSAEMPIGMRAEAFLAARDGGIEPDEARGLATAILEDIGDLVSYVLDPSFSTVRYGERIAASASSFASIREALDASPLLESAYAPLLAAEWKRGTPDYLLVSVPFPGCLLGALACARSCRAAGSATRIVLGGGYVSTELRELHDTGIFDFCDYLSFDSGFGSLTAILGLGKDGPSGPLYKTMYRGADGRVLSGIDETPGNDAVRELEDNAIASIEPDYADADFGSYLQVVDSDNPMHRLWSDSPWLKYRLAQGCYWHRCEFCDTELEYVARFAPVKLDPLLAAADAASRRTGLYGLHFVDEAMPMASLLAFARANRARALAGARPFHYWGNVRFDASWTADRCEYLAASGLVAVAGGIEIATEAGLEMTDKGFDLAHLVQTLVAMKSAGLLVHAYLIYGFPGQSREEIADSAEVCRQLFAAGLVDSAFWHRFVLTRHSRMYAQWCAGDRPRLAPIDRPGDFADNDLRFDGEEIFDEFDGPLSASLDLWMSGRGLDESAGRTLKEVGLARPWPCSIAEGLVEALIAEAEARLDEARRKRDGIAYWIAGRPSARPLEHDRWRLCWTYRGEAREIEMPRQEALRAERILAAFAEESGGRVHQELVASLGLDESDMTTLRSAGLVVT
jgi:hypothetical protein